jgi:hypothetical protein
MVFLISFCPSIAGGNNYWPSSYSTKTKLLYIPALTGCMTIQVQRNQSSPLEGFGNVWAGGGFSTDERLESNLTAVDRPNDAVANHCVEYRYHLTHHRHDHDLRVLSRSRKPIVESLERWEPDALARREGTTFGDSHARNYARSPASSNHWEGMKLRRCARAARLSVRASGLMFADAWCPSVCAPASGTISAARRTCRTSGP